MNQDYFYVVIMHPIFAYRYYGHVIGIEWDTDLVKDLHDPVYRDVSGFVYSGHDEITVYRNEDHTINVPEIVNYDDPDHGEYLMRICNIVQSARYKSPPYHKILILWIKL